MTTREPHVFGELLRRHRLARGLTQEALAEQTGLSARGIADLERGVRRSPYPTTVKRLAAGLRLTPEQLTTLAHASSRARTDEEPFEQPRQHLPIPPTSFVGRDHELVEARELLAGTRLLTWPAPAELARPAWLSPWPRPSRASTAMGCGLSTLLRWPTRVWWSRAWRRFSAFASASACR
jgi:transcriptional regulator with XRE-family HTH domain